MQSVQFNMRGPASYEEYLNGLFAMDPVSGSFARDAMSPEAYAASVANQGPSIDLNNPFADPALAYRGQSEEGSFIPVPGMENVYRVNLQAPGGGERDGLQAYYRVDPQTGQGTMLGEATPFRGMSTLGNIRRGIEQGLPVVAGAALGGYGLMGGSFGLGGLAGAAANGAAVGAGTSAATRGSAQDVLRGGLLGGATGAALYGVGQLGTPSVQDTLSGYDLTARPGIDMGSLPQPVQMPSVGNVPAGPGGLFSPIDIGSLPQPVSLPALPSLPSIPAGFGDAAALLPGQQAQIDVTGTRPKPTAAEYQAPNGIPTLPAAPLPVPDIPPAMAEPMPEIPDVPDGPKTGGGFGAFLGNLFTSPKGIGAVAGGLLGLAGGGSSGGEAEPYTGPMPTITRGQWKPNAQATMMQVPQFGGLLPTTGQANSGLWRFGS